jgi:hypothetical protein
VLPSRCPQAGAMRDFAKLIVARIRADPVHATMIEGLAPINAAKSIERECRRR